MKSGDITRVTGVRELTWCYNCNTGTRYVQLPLLTTRVRAGLHEHGDGVLLVVRIDQDVI